MTGDREGISPMFTTEPSNEREPESLPFFVYGTLLQGEHNHDLFNPDDILSIEPATLKGLSLFSNNFYPVGVEDNQDGSLIHGELITVRGASYESILRNLDILEGVNRRTPLYRREKRRVILSGRPKEEAVLAWVYVGTKVARKQIAKRKLRPISANDWRLRDHHPPT